MKRENRLRLAAAALLLWVQGGAMAAPAVPTVEAGVQQVQASKLAEYRRVIASFDRAIAASPADPAPAVDRCRFIGQFVDDEYGDWVEAAPDEFEACQAALAKRWPTAPQAQMFALEQLWDSEEIIEQAEDLLPGAERWPPALRQQLYAKVSIAEEGRENFERAGEFAVKAVRLGDADRVARAVEYLAEDSRHAEAARLLAGVPAAEEQWSAGRRVDAALALVDRKAAARELARYEDRSWTVDGVIAAKAHLRAGDIVAARRAIADETAVREPIQQVRFDIAMAANDHKAAIATIQPTDTAHLLENMQRFVTLAASAPSTLVQPPMMLGAVMLGLMVLLLATLPGLLLVPVHYRGLARQVRGRPATPLFAVGLSGAWWGTAVLLIVPMLMAAAIDPASTAAMFQGTVIEGTDMFRVMLWGTLAGLVCLVPIARTMGIEGLAGGRDTWLAARWRVPVAWVCLMAVSMAVAAWHSHAGSGAETLQTKSMQALASGAVEAHGLVVTLLLAAVLVPVFEELVFRGLLLGGMTRHIGFGWANTLQAALFALVHDDAPRFAFYFALGLLGGWLVKRTRSIGPAIALHALNNALAFVLMAAR